ncbi:MAG: peptidylprolyl isomerase [Sphaerochaetaceae bacterium]
MPSNDSKTPKKNEAPVVAFTPDEKQKKEKPKKKINITATQIITYVIFALLAVVLIAGVFPSFGLKGNKTSLEFGSYNKEPIVFAQGNYFQRQYQRIASQAKGLSGDAAAYQVWRGAFESTVFHTAVSQRAKEAGYRVVDKTVNQMIIDSGMYDKDGVFDIDTYNKATVESKQATRRDYAEALPIQAVLRDVSSVLSSSKEIEHVLNMGDVSRSFSYAVFDSSLYPDDLTYQYALAHPDKFTLIDVSMVTVATKEQAQQLRQDVADGQKSFEETASGNSIDQYAAEEGKAGVWYLFEIESNFSVPEEVNALFATAEGEISPVFSSPGGYVFYKVNKKPFSADLADAEVLEDVKHYIGYHQTEVTDDYVLGVATEFANSDVADFNEAAGQLKAQTYVAGSTPLNVGSSNYLLSFDYTDMGGYLKYLTRDAAAMRALYSAPVGSIVGPFKVENTYVVATVTDQKPMDEALVSSLKSVYPMIAQQQAQQDMIQSVFASDRFKDNFVPAFVEYVLGSVRPQ